MAVDWNAVSSQLDSAGKDVLDVIKPYLPALAREGPDIYEGFVKHAMERDWAAMDALMYDKMTTEERQELEKDVLSGMRDACLARVRRMELYKDIAFKVVLRLAMTLLLG